MLIVANYHYVRASFNAPYPSIFGLTPGEFAAQLDVLGSIGEFVSLAQVRAAVRGAGRLPERSILITFDDGLREQYEYAWPVLQRKGIPAAFFINTAPIVEAKVSGVHKIHLLRAHIAPSAFLQRLLDAAAEEEIEIADNGDREAAKDLYTYDDPEVARLKYLLNMVLPPSLRDRLIERCFADTFPGQEAGISRRLYMDVAQIQDLHAAGCVGTHAHEHLPIGLLSTEEVRDQIGRSVDFLEEWTGEKPVALSYPYGSREACLGGAAELLASLGIEFAFTMERAKNTEFTRPMLLGRFDCNDVPGGKAARFEADTFFDQAPEASWC